MQISIAFRHIESSEPFKSHIEDKLQKLGRFFAKEPVRAHVVLSQEKFRSQVEVTLNGDHLTFAAVESGDDFYVAFDQVLHKIERQCRSHKDKSKDHKSGTASDAPLYS